MSLRHQKTIRLNAILSTVNGSSNMRGSRGSLFRRLPPENATGNYVKVVQRMPVCIDFDYSPGQDFKAQSLLKPGLFVEPDARAR
jgi:multidrug resistance efflux pump